MHHDHNITLIILSVVIAVFASYTALDLASAISSARGKLKFLWLMGGSLAMGVGIWSMHFVGMLAFSVPGLDISYDVPLLILSILVSILASALALYIVCMRKPSSLSFTVGSLIMGAAIAGMHYIGIWSMRMAASIEWNILYVVLSIIIAIVASYVALLLAFRLREDLSLKGFLFRGAGGVLMGFAIAGMHYTAMAAMHLMPDESVIISQADLLATDGLAAAVIVGTILILGIALSGSNIERALSKKTLMNEALEESIRIRDDFFSIASHELKTPLTSIKLQNEFIIRTIQQKDIEKEKIIQMLDKSGKNIDRLNRLVDDMLEVSRLTSGRLSLQKETFNLSELVTEVMERLMPLMDVAKCEVRLDAEQDVRGEWDRFRIEQVITNLLTNAAKYAPGNPVDIRVYSRERSAFMHIQDHGNGIAPEDQQRIFQRFERIDDRGTTKGLGLGLFITHEIISMHQGGIEIRSEHGKGAEFIVQLPREN